MYTQFYGLASRPFELTPDARFFFESSVHLRAMSYLLYGLHHGDGFVVITGDVGAGKTILVDNLLSTIDPRRLLATKVVTTQLAGDDLLRLVAAEFGIPAENLPKGSVLKRISEFVITQHRSGRRALLIVDEAQHLSFEALEELRMFSNIVVDNKMALQSFLLGQPQFRSILARPEMEQLRQRVTAAYHLGPLSEPETRAYIEHRLRRAGWKGDPSFTEDYFPAIYQYTGGLPRRINTLCSRVLLYGFLEGLRTLNGIALERVALDLNTEMAAVSDQIAAPVNSAPLQAFDLLEQRIGALEQGVGRHQRIIRKAISVAARYFADEAP